MRASNADRSSKAVKGGYFGESGEGVRQAVGGGGSAMDGGMLRRRDTRSRVGDAGEMRWGWREPRVGGPAKAAKAAEAAEAAEAAVGGGSGRRAGRSI
ncbi:hypothetical protein WJ04_24010 [Burkholderia vietnamiensis]|nr:hypothetical protein WJ04_24010 [Burkholderia vietnamiensis]